MKILFFASDYNIGLSTLLTDQIIAYSGIPELDLTGIAGERSQESGLEERIVKNNIRIKRIDGLDDHKDFIKLYKKLKHVIIHENPNFVHVQNNWQLVLIGLVKHFACVPTKIKVVYTIHGFRNFNFLKSIIARAMIGFLLYLFADKVICMSNYVYDKFKVLSNKMTIIYLGVSDSFFEKKVNVINTTKLLMIFPGQFRQGKNQNLIIEAFSEYVKISDDQHAVLCLPGDGELLTNSKELANELGLSKQVIFPGNKTKEEIRKLYEESNIAVISSNSETFGQSIVESFVLGRCILTRSVGVAPDIIKEGVNGYFFKGKDDLIKLMLKLSKEKSQIKRIGDNNFAKRDTFSWSTTATLYCRYILS